jgi:hypothetical protein
MSSPKIKNGKEKNEYVASFFDLTSEEAETLKQMITEVSNHHIEDKNYRELCLTAKQLQRDLEVLRASYMTCETRYRKLRSIFGSTNRHLAERKARQAFLEDEIVDVAIGLRSVIADGLEQKSTRVVLRNMFKPVNTALN